MSIVTISRGSLSGGEHLAEHLGSRLSCPVLSREVLVEAAKRYGVSETELRNGLGKPVRFWERLGHQKERYILAVQAALANMLEGGTGIYHGHAGQFLLRELPGVLKLRLIAPLEYRVRSAMIEFDVSQEEAVRHIETIDARRTKWVHQLYGVDWQDPSLYDLVINLDRMTVESAAEMVIEMLGRREFRSTSETMQTFRDFALATRVRAELTFHSPFSADGVEVTARKGVVRLSGAAFESDRKRIAKFVRGLDGVTQVWPDDEETQASVSSGVAITAQKARDLMLPLDRYPHVHEGISIREAIVALSASSVELRDGHQIYPRYILVFDERERLVGIVARRDLLLGLLPQFQGIEKIREHFFTQIPEDAMSFATSITAETLFSPGAIARSSQPVKSIMGPIKGTVGPNASLSTIVTTAIQEGIDLVPVVDRDKMLGLVLMTDIFDNVAQFIIENSGRFK